MSATDVTAEVVRICRETLGDPTLHLDSTAATVEGWDSLGHMNLITALEERFGFELDILEMAEVDGVRALVALVESTLAGGSGVA